MDGGRGAESEEKERGRKKGRRRGSGGQTENFASSLPSPLPFFPYSPDADKDTDTKEDKWGHSNRDAESSQTGQLKSVVHGKRSDLKTYPPFLAFATCAGTGRISKSGRLRASCGISESFSFSVKSASPCEEPPRNPGSYFGATLIIVPAREQATAPLRKPSPTYFPLCSISLARG